MKYTPFFRDQTKFEIQGYKRKYQTDNSTENQSSEEQDAPVITAVESDVPEIRDENPSSRTQPVNYKGKDNFVRFMLPIYERVLKQRGLNPAFAKSLVAQDGLETAWGAKTIGRFNFGNIKGSSGTSMNVPEFLNNQWTTQRATFRDYNSPEEYVNAKIDLLSLPRYSVFSGPISEFASRVKAGGYATSPTYTETLNRVIASIKNGGVVKYEEGGEAKSWVKDWLRSRSNIYKSNWDSIALFPFTSNLARRITETRIDNTPIIITDNIDPKTAGHYDTEAYVIRSKTRNPSVLVHEVTHSSTPVAQVKAIDRIKELYGDAMYDSLANTKEDDYWDDSGEIYARIMQFRHDLGVDPKHEFTEEEIEELKKGLMSATLLTIPTKDGRDIIISESAEGTHRDPALPGMNGKNAKLQVFYDSNGSFDILNRYSTPFIKAILNGVASSKRFNSDNA